MDCYKTLILLFFGNHLISCSQFPPRTYYFIEKEMNWTEALHICRENYTDLAIFKNMDDVNSFQPMIEYGWAWIGLWDDPQAWKYAMGHESNSWRWSKTGETSKTGYSNWATGEPQYMSAEETCVGVTNFGKWKDLRCGSAYYFMCYKGYFSVLTNGVERTYELIKDTKTWAAALNYCREHYTDLAMIESAEENTEVSALSDAEVVWIGLYRVPWTWPDNSQSSFTNWEYGSPNNYDEQHCVIQNDNREWNDDVCHGKYPFICHQVSRLRKMLRVEFHTGADVSDPAVSAQILQKLSAVLASQGWTDVNLKWRIQPRKIAEDGVESKDTGGKPNGKVPPGLANKN